LTEGVLTQAAEGFNSMEREGESNKFSTRIEREPQGGFTVKKKLRMR